MHKRDKLFLILFPTGIVLCVLIVLAIKLSADLEEKRWADIPAISVTFDTIASHEGDKVSIEGKILVGSGVSEVDECGCDECNNIEKYRSCYRLDLTSVGDYDPTEPRVSLDMYNTTQDKREPNHFYLPIFFDPGEFRIYTNDGQELTEDDPIRVIGFVCDVLEGNGIVRVYMCVMTIEAAE
ncbi:MAG: hypothetical protein AB9897_04575 [Anaerolineaceae bacterium]